MGRILGSLFGNIWTQCDYICINIYIYILFPYTPVLDWLHLTITCRYVLLLLCPFQVVMNELLLLTCIPIRLTVVVGGNDVTSCSLVHRLRYLPTTPPLFYLFSIKQKPSQSRLFFTYLHPHSSNKSLKWQGALSDDMKPLLFSCLWCSRSAYQDSVL